MNRSLHTLAAALVAVTAMASAQAQVTVTDAWARATVPQQRSTGAFMQLRAARNSRLVAARSPVADTVEVHEMALRDGIMRMRQVAAVELPAGQPVALSPGGYHVMLMGLHAQVKEGDTLPLVLVVEDRDGRRDAVEVRATVRALGAGAPH